MARGGARAEAEAREKRKESSFSEEKEAKRLLFLWGPLLSAQEAVAPRGQPAKVLLILSDKTKELPAYQPSNTGLYNPLLSCIVCQSMEASNARFVAGSDRCRI
jgi:hypothetical protein